VRFCPGERMTWTAPEVPRTEPPLIAAGEREALETWLGYPRETLLFKGQGLTAERLAARPLPPSALSLPGLVRHLTEIEQTWFSDRLADLDVAELYCSDEDPDGDFDLSTAADAEPASRPSPVSASSPARSRRAGAWTRRSCTSGWVKPSTCAGSAST